MYACRNGDYVDCGLQSYDTAVTDVSQEIVASVFRIEMFLSSILKTGKEFSSETSAFIYQNVQLRFHKFGIVVTIFLN
jgi:hypothetical protein